jgi:type I restriction enzyme S subunit
MFFKESEIDKCTATKEDLLVCEGGDIGRTAIWNYDYDIRIQNHIHKLRAYVTD